MSKPRILAFAGSVRKDSYNHRLLLVAAEGARAAGADMTVLDLNDYPLPIFDEDLEREHGTPENATKLKQSFLDHDGLLIASPEYNSSITPLLKNTIDRELGGRRFFHRRPSILTHICVVLARYTSLISVRL